MTLFDSIFLGGLVVGVFSAFVSLFFSKVDSRIRLFIFLVAISLLVCALFVWFAHLHQWESDIFNIYAQEQIDIKVERLHQKAENYINRGDYYASSADSYSNRRKFSEAVNAYRMASVEYENASVEYENAIIEYSDLLVKYLVAVKKKLGKSEDVDFLKNIEDILKVGEPFEIAMEFKEYLERDEHKLQSEYLEKPKEILDKMINILELEIYCANKTIDVLEKEIDISNNYLLQLTFPMYSRDPSVPDFGKISGYLLLSEEIGDDSAGWKCLYTYLKEDNGNEAISKYKDALTDCGYIYLFNTSDENGTLEMWYDKYDVNRTIAFGYGSTTIVVFIM